MSRRIKTCVKTFVKEVLLFAFPCAITLLEGL